MAGNGRRRSSRAKTYSDKVDVPRMFKQVDAVRCAVNAANVQ